MVKIKTVLQLLKQLRDNYQSNQGMTAKELDQAKAMLEEAIDELEGYESNRRVITVDKLLVLVGNVVSVLPSVINLINQLLQ